MQEPGNEARDLIRALTFQMQSLTQALQQHNQLVQARLQSDQALAGFMNHYSTKLEAFLERLEDVEHQYARLEQQGLQQSSQLDARLKQVDGRLGQLIQAIQGEDVTLPVPPPPAQRGRYPNMPSMLPNFTPGQYIGGGLGYMIDQFSGQARGRGGRGRPR